VGRFLRRTVGRVLLIEGALIAAVLARGAVAGLRSADDLGMTRTWMYQYIETTNPRRTHERASRDGTDIAHSAALVFPSVLLGRLTIIAGTLLR